MSPAAAATAATDISGVVLEIQERRKQAQDEAQLQKKEADTLEQQIAVVRQHAATMRELGQQVRTLLDSLGNRDDLMPVVRDFYDRATAAILDFDETAGEYDANADGNVEKVNALRARQAANEARVAGYTEALAKLQAPA